MSHLVESENMLLKPHKRPASSMAEKMVKVDHAGENGAVNIYRAQYLASTFRSPRSKAQIKEFQRHEEKHRHIFKTYLEHAGVRRCVSYHLCGIGGFALGFITGLIGPSAVAATTYAVENVVLEHLQHQLPYLKENAPGAFMAVSAIYEDEKAHHDQAKAQMQEDKLMSKILVRIIRGCTQAVIWFGMR